MANATCDHPLVELDAAARGRRDEKTAARSGGGITAATILDVVRILRSMAMSWKSACTGANEDDTLCGKDDKLPAIPKGE